MNKYFVYCTLSWKKQMYRCVHKCTSVSFIDESLSVLLFSLDACVRSHIKKIENKFLYE